MLEEEFEALRGGPPWRHADFLEFERVRILGERLWGNAEHMREQLLADSPHIPEGLALSDLLVLERRLRCEMLLPARPHTENTRFAGDRNRRSPANLAGG